MVVFKKVADLTKYINNIKSNEHKIGFVPTMGALHKGHISLVLQSNAMCDITVCSIFVNPTQFNDKNDLAKYPRTIEADIALLESNFCDVLFLPDVEEMYPDGLDAVKSYDFGYLDTILEGAKRPGHFKGVGQIVGRLLEIVTPDILFLGQKDYQQCMVVKSLIKQMNLSKLELQIVKTSREEDGLAMSSRNKRLTEPQRVISAIIYQCLVSIQAKKNRASFSVVQKECVDLMVAKGMQPEYVEIANSDTLELLNEYNDDVPMIALIATWSGDVRLIDNMLL